MEVLGGNGYVEESTLPRLYREMPVNSIWEGSGNVMTLDVVRAVRREPAAVAALAALLAEARGANSHYDAHASALMNEIATLPDEPAAARRIAQAIATTCAASILVRHAPAPVADGYCATRLGSHAFGGGTFGALALQSAASIVERTLPG
jgi:putative acyl-CoA dehydrogenase